MHAKKILLIAGALLAVLAGNILLWDDLRFDSDLWVDKDHPIQVSQDYLADEFTAGENLTITLSLTDSFFSSAHIAWVGKLESQLKQLPYILDIRSPLSAKTIIPHGDALEVRSFKNALDKGVLTDMEHYASEFTTTPYNGRLLSTDHRTVAIEMQADTRDNASRRAELLHSLRAVLATHEGDIGIVGDAALKGAINDAVRGELVSLLGIAALVFILFLALVLRHLWQTITLIACMVFAVTTCLSSIHWLGHHLTPVSICLPVMVAIISIADGLHIFALWNSTQQSQPSYSARLYATIRKSWLPCLLASTSSAVGFGAFSFSELIPLRHFGMDATLAIALCYPIIVGTIWGALFLFPSAFRSSPRPRTAIIANFMTRLPNDIFTRRRALGGLFLILTAVFLSSLWFVRTETNFLTVFFSPKSPIYRDFMHADHHLGGTGAIDVIVQDDAEYFRQINAMQDIEHFATAFQQHPLVNHSDSYLMPLGIVHKALSGAPGLPTDNAELEQELLFLDLSRSESERDMLGDYLNFDSSAAHIRLQTPNLRSDQLEKVLAHTKNTLHDTHNNVLITGSGNYIHALSQYVLSTQVGSFTMTIGFIAVLFCAFFGWRLGIIGTMANIFPVLVTTGSIALLDIPFDFATILIAGITLGLSVDDAIHFLHHYRTAAHDHSPLSAVARTTKLVWQPIVLTSILFCIGVATLGTSELVLMVKFAIFTALGFSAAFVSTLVFLPAMILLTTKNRNPTRISL